MSCGLHNIKGFLKVLNLLTEVRKLICRKKNLEYTYFKEKQWSHHITVSLKKEAKQLQQKIVRFYCFEMNIKVRMFGSNIKALRVLNSLKPSIHPFQIHYYFNSEPLFMLKIKETNLWTISDFSTFL